jgi:uncharacterized membrane protein
MAKSKQKKLPFRVRIRNSIRSRLLSGLLVVVPAGITVLVLRFLYNFTAGRLTPLVKKFLSSYPDYVVTPASILILFALLYFVGLVASVVVGRKLIGTTESIIQRIPMVKTVYNASKQMVETLSFQNQDTEFKMAVFVEFPSPGMRALGFITGRIRLPDGLVYFKVFIPTTPNITVGILELVPVDRVYHSGLLVEDAIKTVVSVGILCPPRLKLTPMSQLAKVSGPDSDSDDDTEEEV